MPTLNLFFFFSIPKKNISFPFIASQKFTMEALTTTKVKVWMRLSYLVLVGCTCTIIFLIANVGGIDADGIDADGVIQ